MDLFDTTADGRLPTAGGEGTGDRGPETGDGVDHVARAATPPASVEEGHQDEVLRLRAAPGASSNHLRTPNARTPNAEPPNPEPQNLPPPFDYATTPVLPGRTLVEASAGTGKTFAIAGLVLRLVLDPKAGGDDGPDWLADASGRPDLRRLLVVTFTNAATEELKTRIRAALRTALAVARAEVEPDDLTRPLADLLRRPVAEERLLAALDRVDEAGIVTIHGFCKRILEQSAFESGTPFEMDFVEDSDSDALRARAAADAWARRVHGDALLAALLLDTGRTPSTLVQHHKAISDFPHVTIRPERPSFEDARSALADATEALRQAWDADAAREALAPLGWNKNAPLDGPEGDARLDRVTAFAEGRDPDGLATVRLCTPSQIQAFGAKRSKDQKAQLAAAQQWEGFAACERVAQAADVLDLAFVRTFTREIGGRIEAIKERRRQLTFSDLITRLHDALLDGATGPLLAQSIRRLFSVAIIDEFQDTDPQQYAIFRRAFDGRPLYFVGDPKQAIYAFRGADVHAYLGAQREATRRFTLGTNWRSTARLVEAVNRVFEQPERAFLFDGIPFRRVASSPAKQKPRLVDPRSGEGQTLPPLVWWPTPTRDGRPLGKTAANESIPPAVAAEVSRLLREARMQTDESDAGPAGDRPVTPADIAVLVPTRYEAAEILRALQALNVPAVVSRADDVRQSAEIAEIELLLRAVLAPDDERALRAALATTLWGWSAAEIADLDEQADEAERLNSLMRGWNRTWRTRGVLHVLTDFQHTQGVLARVLATPDGERRATNLRHVRELLHDIERAGDRSPEDLLHWIRHREDQALPSREMKELRLERDAEAVTITTHHNAKGLEYEIVFLPYLWSLSERDYTMQAQTLARTEAGVVYDLGSPDQAETERMRQVDNLAEHVRKAYVALTRARERCYVIWGQVLARRQRLDAKSGLGYLLAGHRAPLATAGGGVMDGGLGTEDREPSASPSSTSPLSLGEGQGEGAFQAAPDALAAHVESARRTAAVDDPLAAIREMDPSEEVMCIRDPLAVAEPYRPDAGPTETVGERALGHDARQRARDAWRRASFSGWTRHSSGSHGSEAEATALAASDEADATTRDEAPPAGLHAFAAGTGPGTCLHAILQHARWEEPEDADDRERTATDNREIVERYLTAHGLDRPGRPHRAPIQPVDEVEALVQRVAAAPLFASVDQEPRRLADAGHLLAEWPFAFPLGRIAPAALADVFRAHGTEPFGAEYADALARLSREAADGLMVGEIDVVALVDDRWWVADWKFNRLGSDPSAYTPEALRTTMMGHHYGLQLHLYTLGLHRFLRSRLSDSYGYDTHVGGATYAFLRGMGERPSTEPPEATGGTPLADASRSGLFSHRPTAALIEALDRLLVPDA
ncbi:MAG: UvrD-helicase domain-containing protein [Bacteroidota bacterium]